MFIRDALQLRLKVLKQEKVLIFWAYPVLRVVQIHSDFFLKLVIHLTKYCSFTITFLDFHSHNHKVKVWTGNFDLILPNEFKWRNQINFTSGIKLAKSSGSDWTFFVSSSWNQVGKFWCILNIYRLIYSMALRD